MITLQTVLIWEPVDAGIIWGFTMFHSEEMECIDPVKWLLDFHPASFYLWIGTNLLLIIRCLPCMVHVFCFPIFKENVNLSLWFGQGVSHFLYNVFNMIPMGGKSAKNAGFFCIFFCLFLFSLFCLFFFFFLPLLYCQTLLSERFHCSERECRALKLK